MVRPGVPAWVKDAIFYQIFPDRFAMSERVAKPDNLEPWDAPPTMSGYKGGDLLGVVERLEYLQDLGVNAIYVNPIFQSASNHRYHTHDYYQVDPLLGGNDAFRELRAETARRGMRIILDGVFNHASRGNFYFNDILENGEKSPWLHWFHVHAWPLRPYGDGPANYEAWAGLKALPRWNTENPDVREYLIRVGEHWVREGIDGWRLDVPFEISAPGFWHEFRSRVRAINPDCYLVAEIWWNAHNALRGDQFDATMNYLFTEAVIQFAGQDAIQYDLVRGPSYDPYPGITARHYADKIDHILGTYAWETDLGQFNLLGSHDTARLRSILNEDEAGIRLATLLLLTFPGAPSVYYGDEVGVAGGMDPDCRRAFPWDEARWNHAALAYHKQFIRLRREHAALRTGGYRRLYPQDQDDPTARAVYVFARHDDAETLIIAVNSDRAARQVAIPLDGLARPGATPAIIVGAADAISVNDGRLDLRVSARDALVIGV
jgi:glycosidase